MATASLGLNGTKVPIIAWPLVTEFYPEGNENKAFPLSQNIPFFESLPSYISHESLHEDWWSPTLCGDESRVGKFLNWLSVCPESRVAIFTHWGFIRRLLQEVNFHDSYSPDNCTPIEIRFGPSRLLIDAPQYAIMVLPSSTNQNNELLAQISGFYEYCQNHPVLQTATGIGPMHISVADFWPLTDEDREKLRLKLFELAKVFQGPNAPPLLEPATSTAVEMEKALFVRLDVMSAFLEQLRRTLTSAELGLYTGSEYVVRRTFHISLLRDDKPAGKSFVLSDFSEALEKYPLVEKMFTGNGEATDEEWNKCMQEIRWTLMLTSQTGEVMKFRLFQE
eukprot:TRINITY_DN646_c0_g1_i3.p1 TRINITY_DN646_c0_g1~~TRINITY_DN646_c0_g1_i3.p1  ORF type:complete len:336 (+),score=33.76 TRINITY_DN646_c0_g1_i3:427-1434(+)